MEVGINDQVYFHIFWNFYTDNSPRGFVLLGQMGMARTQCLLLQHCHEQELGLGNPTLELVP